MSARNRIPSAPRETSRSLVIRKAIEIAEDMALEAGGCATNAGITGAVLALMVGAGLSRADAAGVTGVDVETAETMLSAHAETLRENPAVERWWKSRCALMPSAMAVAS